MVSCVAIMDKNAPKFNKDLALFKNQLEKQLSINVYKNGQWGSYRHLLTDQLQTVKADHAYLNALTYGDLSSLRWIQGGINLQDEKKLVHVYYSALNFRDTMMASGRISLDAMSNGRLAQDCSIGMEFSGRTKNGVRVMGMSINRSMANVISAECDMLWPIPEQWTLEEGATIPVAYATIFYAFFVLNKFKPGCRVLIHAGAGGVGQAAIRVCLFYGCEIFTTVGTQAKRDFIRKMFPKIKESHIGNSRDTSFEDMIMKETNGEGVDYVLNSLAEEKLQASVGCLGFKGKFLEIGKFDILNNHLLGLKFFSKGRSFQGIVMDLIMQNASKDRIKIHKLIMDHIRNGCIKPICRIIFDTNEAEKAFRFMSSGKHIGKVLIRIRPEEKERNAKPEPISLDALPRFYCHPECSYILVGGLGGFGLELTDWLVLRGARKIVLNSRRGVVNGYQSFKMKTWSDYGVQVVISKEDVSTRKGCEDLLQKAATLGPVRGIFNLAVVLKDAIFENQTPEMFKTSLAPKAVATKLLDIESRRLCLNLKNFVVFSSVSCGRGNAGQTNYGMANSIMERICEERQRAGYPALAIQWGAVGEVGLVADMQEEHMELEIGGTLQQRISSCLGVMDTFLSQSAPVVSSMVVAEKKTAGACIGDVVGTVASILGLKDLKTVSPEIKLAELGMDSIMAVEIRQIMEREFNIITTPQDVRMMTFARLVQLAENLEYPETHVSPVDSKANDIGLGIFIRNLGEEEQAYEAVLEMPTMIIENICKTTPKIFMVPGIEGMAVVFESLCKKLHCEASVLQIEYDHPEQDISSIAKRFLEPVRSALLPSSEFIILGYSFGTDITLEMAKALESEGHIGKIVLIDGSPEFVYSYVKANLRSWDLDIMQNGLLSLLFDIFSPKSKVNILAALKTCSKWDEKVEHFIRNLPSDNKYSKVFLRKILTSIFKRLHSIPSYNLSSETKLKSDAILLRPKILPAGVAIEENYCLNKYFEKSVKVHMLEGDHSSIIDNENCANIINEIVAERH